MTRITVRESGILMSFDQADVFIPEKTDSYIRFNHFGIKICDIIWLYETPTAKEILLVEIKSSIPRNSLDRCDYFETIKQKMNDSLLWYFAVLTNKIDANKIGVNLHKLSILKKPVKFVLIIPEMPAKHLSEARDMLQQFLRPIAVMFQASVLVLNKTIAKRAGFSVLER